MITWLKRKWTLVVIFILVLALLKNFINTLFGINISSMRIPDYQAGTYSGSADIALSPKTSSFSNLSSISLFGNQAPPTETANRLVIKDTSLSLVVNDVAGSITKIEDITKSLGGFLVNSYLSRPQEAANGNITIRVPEDKRTDALNQFKKLSVKVISESIIGTDVTDQYVDLDARLTTLNKTKAKFESILDQATAINDLLNVQREIINLQSQIDSLKGQQNYLSQSAKLAKITLYVSTDELTLPYAPTDSWRPLVIFKQAVRSMVTSLRGIGSLLIWLLAYLPIIIPIILLIWFFNRRSKLLQPHNP
jgi:hypothetical protein